MRIGVYSGTFDPVHNGHLALAQAALIEAELDRVLFIPEALPRGKTQVTALEHRVRMLELATADHLAYSVITLRSQQFTVQETLPELQGLFPGAQLVLIMGSDVAKHLTTRWPDLDAALERLEFGIGLRGHDEIHDVQSALAQYPQATYSVMTAPYPHAASSSARISCGHKSDIPLAVASYITAQKLYV